MLQTRQYNYLLIGKLSKGLKENSVYSVRYENNYGMFLMWATK